MRKIISLFLILVILLAACSSGESNTSETTSETETNSTSEENVEQYTSAEEAYSDMENRLLNKQEAYTLKEKTYFPYGESNIIAKYAPTSDSFSVTQNTVGRDLDEDGEEFNYQKSFNYTIYSNNKITNETFDYEEDDHGYIYSYSDTDYPVNIYLFTYSKIIDDYKYMFEYADDYVMETKFSYKFNFINLEGHESYTEDLLENQIANIEIYKDKQYLNFNYKYHVERGNGEITFE